MIMDIARKTVLTARLDMARMIYDHPFLMLHVDQNLVLTCKRSYLWTITSGTMPNSCLAFIRRILVRDHHGYADRDMPVPTFTIQKIDGVIQRNISTAPHRVHQ
jgi:hypothetical protein